MQLSLIIHRHQKPGSVPLRPTIGELVAPGHPVTLGLLIQEHKVCEAHASKWFPLKEDVLSVLLCGKWREVAHSEGSRTAVADGETFTSLFKNFLIKIYLTYS